MHVQRFFFTRANGHFKHAHAVILQYYFVILWGSNDRVQ
nr:D589 [uncultured bacterium]